LLTEIFINIILN